MALRLFEVTVPGDELDALDELLAESRAVDAWSSAADGGRATARLLVEVRHSEELSDDLVGRFGSADGFRLVSLAVEATLPSVDEKDEEEAEEGEEEASGEGAEDEEDEAEGPRRISREELYEDLANASRLSVVYLVTVALSTIVAAVGLIRGDVAIVIGAMVIAPLLGPNVALSLAATLGDLDLAGRSLKAVGAGVATSAAVSLALGLVLTVDPASAELAARSRAGIGDVALALSAGAAGALAFTSGVPAAVVGVMVAVALLPPLVAAGLLAGSGHLGPAGGAMVLVLTNVTCVNLAAVATFFLQRVRPRTWWEAKRAKRATRIAVATWAVLLALLVGLILLGQVGGV